MIKRSGIIAFFVFGSILFGQLDSNSATVTASRSTNLQPDAVVFAVQVTSGLNTSLDDVLAAVKGVGLTIGNFAGVGSSLPTGVVPIGVAFPQPPATGLQLQWTFALPVPFAQMKTTFAALGSLQQSIVQNNSGLGLAFVVQGAQVSPGLRQAQMCSIPDLIADATAQAQKLATAGGLTLGQILAMSTVTSVPAPAAPATGVAFSSFLIATPLVPQISTQVCTLTVKFGLTRF